VRGCVFRLDCCQFDSYVAARPESNNIARKPRSVDIDRKMLTIQDLGEDRCAGDAHIVEKLVVAFVADSAIDGIADLEGALIRWWFHLGRSFRLANV